MEAIIIFAVVTLANLAGGTVAADAYYDYRQVPEGRVEMLEARAADPNQNHSVAVEQPTEEVSVIVNTLAI